MKLQTNQDNNLLLFGIIYEPTVKALGLHVVDKVINDTEHSTQNQCQAKIKSPIPSNAY